MLEMEIVITDKDKKKIMVTGIRYPNHLLRIEFFQSHFVNHYRA